MAAMLGQMNTNREITVDRAKLLVQLTKNREKHIQEYEEAIAGYQSLVLAKLEEKYAEAKTQLEERYNKLKDKIGALTEADIPKQKPNILLIDSVVLAATVPRSYADAYEVAIDMITWTASDTVVLTYQEFQCFVRNEWEWTAEFVRTTSMYKMS